MKYFISLVILISFSIAVHAGINEVPGLKLPPPQEVPFDSQFITLIAECKGQVQWLVTVTGKINCKTKINKADPKEIDIGIPPYESTITIFAVGAVDNKLTEFARTEIRVKGPSKPNPEPQPPQPETAKLKYFSIIENPAARTEGIRNILLSNDLFDRLGKKGIVTRVYSVNDTTELKQNHFDEVLKDKKAPLLILQDATGKGLEIILLPDNVNEILKVVAKYTGDI